MTLKERYKKTLDWFLENRPVAETELVYKNPFELLVAVILSAQCTDKRVNLTTPAFFSRFPDVETLASASQDEVFSYIRSISYPNNKAKHLIGMAMMIVAKFNGLVPETVSELQELPGVGRKTANVIASVIYKLPAMAVDTHVFRVAARIGLTTGAKTPEHAEDQLMKHIPRELIPKAHHWLILHGRYTCLARTPQCERCGLTIVCKYFNKQLKPNAITKLGGGKNRPLKNKMNEKLFH